MDWVLLSLASAAGFAVVGILDKVILSRIAPSPATFTVLTGLIQIPGSAIPLFIVPMQSYPIDVWVTAVASGFLWGTSLVVMFWVLSREEVSEVIAIYQTSPVFVAIMAVIFLSENLSPWHWVAIIVTVAGAGLISLRRNGGSRRMTLDASFLFLLFAGGLVAAGQLLTKVAADEMSFWNLYSVRSLALASAMIILPIRPSVLPEARRVLADRAGTGLLVLTEGFLGFGSMIVTLLAISLGPISLVSTLMSARPLFVFVFSVVLSAGAWRLLDEPLNRETLVRKAGAIAMIFGGIAAISLL